MIVKSSHCKRCGSMIDTNRSPEWRLQAVQYPYNPEWTPTVLEAGIFCGRSCVIAYLTDTEEPERNP